MFDFSTNLKYNRHIKYESEQPRNGGSTYGNGNFIRERNK